MVLTISSSDELEDLLRENANNYKLLIIDFFTTWCGPCLLFSTEYERLSVAYQSVSTFIKVDCDLMEDIAIKYRIKSLPTVKGFFNNQEAFSLIGQNVYKLSTEITENTILSCLKDLFINKTDAKPLKYLVKVVNNIIDYPNDDTYRILKLKNESVQNNLLAFVGVKECLLFLGFQENDEQLFMSEAILPKMKQFKKQLLMLLSTSISSQSPGESSNSNINKYDTKDKIKSLPNKTIESSLNTDFSIETQRFLGTINSHSSAIKLYENVDLMNIVNFIVDIDSYKLLSQEIVLKKLLRWFKYDFFSWFSVPNCELCNKPYVHSSITTPTIEESHWLANIVELYKCQSCSSVFRFPRYNHPEKLLTSRTGRCGEWANCFSLVLRTFINAGIFQYARFVHDWSDHVWCEVYMKLDDESEARWIHVDPCEGTYNAPLTYEAGWKKKISYVIGITLISGDVQDITWRYTTNIKLTLSNRQLINEHVLVNKLLEYHKQAGTDPKIIFKELVSFLPNKNSNIKLSADEMVGRTTGSEEWRSQRGEIGDQPKWKKRHLGQHIKPTSFELLNNCLHIQYNCSIDLYHRPCDIESNKYISGQGEVGSSSSASTGSPGQRKISTTNRSGKDLLSHDSDGWQSLASSWMNIKRKVEYDWQVVYLARMDVSSPDNHGEISWTIDLSDSNKKISEISIFASSAEFNNATVKWKLHSINIERPVNGFLTTTDFNNCSVVTLTALLKSDPATVDRNSWQHAQLCRQKSTDFDVKTLQIKVELQDV